METHTERLSMTKILRGVSYFCPSYECKEDVGFHFKTDATDVIKGDSSAGNIMHR